MSERRYKGYDLDTRHGFFGTFSLWEVIIIFGTALIGGGLTPSNGTAPMIYTALSGAVALIGVLVTRRTLAQKPNYFKHLFAYINRPDFKHIKPERDYVPVLPDAKRRN